MTLWKILEEFDEQLFVFIHNKMTDPSLDGVMLLLRNALTWVPLYAFMLYWIIRYGKKYAWQFILFTVLVFAITDYSSASLLKSWIGRLRPCWNPDLQPYLRNLVGCGGQYGMPSSHAANHFGLAAFWFWTIRRIKGQRWIWLWVWAFAICYAQVYVGKHYPFDIIAGAFLGYATGTLFARIFELWQFASNTHDKRITKQFPQAQ